MVAGFKLFNNQLVSSWTIYAFLFLMIQMKFQFFQHSSWSGRLEKENADAWVDWQDVFGKCFWNLQFKKDFIFSKKLLSRNEATNLLWKGFLRGEAIGMKYLSCQFAQDQKNGHLGRLFKNQYCQFQLWKMNLPFHLKHSELSSAIVTSEFRSVEALKVRRKITAWNAC